MIRERPSMRVAFLARDLNPHFLLFIATGALLGAFAFVGRTRR